MSRALKGNTKRLGGPLLGSPWPENPATRENQITKYRGFVLPFLGARASGDLDPRTHATGKAEQTHRGGCFALPWGKSLGRPHPQDQTPRKGNQKQPGCFCCAFPGGQGLSKPVTPRPGLQQKQHTKIPGDFVRAQTIPDLATYSPTSNPSYTS